MLKKEIKEDQLTHTGVIICSKCKKTNTGWLELIGSLPVLVCLDCEGKK